MTQGLEARFFYPFLASFSFILFLHLFISPLSLTLFLFTMARNTHVLADLNAPVFHPFL